MDTTPEYKTQCKAAFEDIGFIFNEGPDNLLIVDDDELLRTCLNSKEKIEHYHGQLFTIYGQLYRQDQLQGLVEITKSMSWHFFLHTDGRLQLTYFKDDLQSETRKIFRFNSIEQLDLALVMYQKFGKTWDSDKEQWVKEG